MRTNSSLSISEAAPVTEGEGRQGIAAEEHEVEAQHCALLHPSRGPFGEPHSATVVQRREGAPVGPFCCSASGVEVGREFPMTICGDSAGRQCGASEVGSSGQRSRVDEDDERFVVGGAGAFDFRV